MKIPVTKDEIISAGKRIAPYVHKTPLLSSSKIDSITGAKLIFKCENFQKVGAFKMRGAANALLSLSDEQLRKGVATHSSGNHAAALARAAQNIKVPAYIVMPQNSPINKIEAVRSYGGKITFCEPNLKAREETLNKVIEQTGATFIHPYNNWDVITGQSTAAYELITESKSTLDYILAPVGGGGLLSGTALSAHYFTNGTKVIGCEPEGADDAFRSLRDGVIYPSLNPNTIADGLLTSLGEKTFAVISRYVEEIITASEKTIAEAMFLIMERQKVVIEPSSALPLATILENPDRFTGKTIGVILSGGNLDFSKINSYLELKN
jgi:threonine dehydratase